MDFSVFDTRKIDAYAAQAKEAWGNTESFREFEEKDKNRNGEERQKILTGLMEFFVEFGAMRTQEPSEKKVQEQVKKLQDYITEHFYNCTKDILKMLGKMYAGGGSMTENIDKAGGAGTAEFAANAIEIYCDNGQNP